MIRTLAVIGLFSSLVCTSGCLSSSTYEEDRARLDAELVELRGQLSDSENERDVMALKLNELSELRRALDEASQARIQLLSRLEDLDRNQIRPLAEHQTEQKALLRDLDQVRMNEIRTELADLRARLEGLNQRTNDYQSATSTREVVRMQKELADLDARMEVHDRLSESNRTNIEQLNRTQDDLVANFNRQMRLLEQYLNAQFVPLAQELVGYLYAESRRMGQSAEQLEELGRKVDPYKFSHLVPKLDTPDAAQPTPAKQEDGK